MGIRLKVLIVFVICFGLMAGVSLLLLKRSMDESYDAIERTDIVANMGRVEQSFEASALSLRTLTTDWAVWNEMYRYALDPDPEWAKDAISQDALAPADLTVVMIYNKSGQLLTASTIENQGINLDTLLPQLDAYLKHILKDTQKTECGIAGIDAGLVLICWAGIVQSNASGEVAGTVVMGRLLDSTRQARLREQTKLPFVLAASHDLPAGLAPWPELLTSGSIGSGEFWSFSDPDVYHLYYPVRDILGKKAGMITLDVPRAVHKQGLLLYQQVRQQLLVSVLILTALLALALHFLLIRRLRSFARQIDGLEAGATGDRRVDVGGRDELGLVAESFNKLLALINAQVQGLQELLEVKESSLNLIQMTQAQLILSEKKAQLRQQRVSNLLNNSGQGFLSFGADLLIDPEVSRACTEMLGSSLAGRSVAEVLGGDDPSRKDLFYEVIAAVLAEPDADVGESMLSLLPADLSRGETLLKAEYKRLENSRFMVVLTDITEERRLEGMVKEERQRLEFIVAVVSDRKNFFAAIDGFNEFLATRLQAELAQDVSPDMLASLLFREVHTYKGLFNQFGFMHTPGRLHQLETQLSGLLSGDAVTLADIAQAASPDDLRESLEEDLAVLTQALGHGFMESRHNVVLSGALIHQLEDLAMRLLQGEPIDASENAVRHLLNDVLTVRKLTFKEILLGFNGLVKQVALRLGKEVAPVAVHGGDDFWIDPKPYQPFIQSLGHVFRNAVAHGLETPESRWAAEKDEIGKIDCHVSLASSAIVLLISDDGSGIDLAAIRQRALTAGIITAAELSAMSDEQVAALIFRDGMSAQHSVTQIAGRGVGLAAALSETRKLGGDVAIRTLPGKGTQFLFTLPLRHVMLAKARDLVISKTLLDDEVEFIMHSIIATLRDYFETEHGVWLVDADAATEEPGSPELLGPTAIIAMEGRLDLRVVLSVQDRLADAVYEWMTAGFNEVPDDQEENRKAAVGELLNTVLGQCTKDIEHLDRQGIGLTSPMLLDRDSCLPSMIGALRGKRCFTTEHGRLTIMLTGALHVSNTSLDS